MTSTWNGGWDVAFIYDIERHIELAAAYDDQERGCYWQYTGVSISLPLRAECAVLPAYHVAHKHVYCRAQENMHFD